MRIAHIVQDLDPAMGGLATVPVTMARWQAKAGHDVELWTSSAHGAHAAAQGTGLAVIERPGRAGLLDRDFVGRFRDELRRVDVVHTHSFWRPYVASFIAAAAALGKPSVHTMHGMFMDWPMRSKRLKKKLFLALAGRRALRTVSAVHMLNQGETVQSRHLGANFRFFELPNGVDTAEFAALPPRGALRASDPALRDRTIVTSLGRLHDIKGADLLLRAFLDVSAEYPNAVLVMAGPDEGMLPALRTLLEGHPAADRVRLPGLLRGPARLALLADTDIFVQPSRHETMSMSILEAAYAGRALLLSDRCNAPEFGDAGAGEVVSTTTEGIRDGLRMLLADEGLRARLGAAAKRLVEDRFTLARVTPRMIANYEALLRGEQFPWVL